MARKTVPALPTYLRSAAERDLHAGPDQGVAQVLNEMVTHPDYPCLGARSVFRRDGAQIVVLEEMSERAELGELAQQLEQFAAATDPQGPFASLIAVFRSPTTATEAQFEALLWTVLQGLHDDDEHPWAPGVSPDPSDPHFAFSHAGTAFFIVGLHPGASRIARRAPLPTLVFNLHEQFELLREQGGFDRMRNAIRTRDERLQGDTNPMAADHGGASEARQYSGRAVSDAWSPSFRPHEETR
ncbi:guanitoxin biosynthesis heme-dependent pre-guanitoxin N-hydroxylase GntA [Dermatophilaceae bacterium Sec6.4]